MAQLLMGPKIGAQATIMQYDKNKEYIDSVTTSFVPGFSIGSLVNIYINKPFSLQFEANYSLKGRSIQGVFDPYLNHKERNHYIEVPALLRYSVGKKRKNYYLNAGPNLSYWLGGGGILTNSSLKDAGIREYPYTLSFKEGNDDVGKIFIKDPNRFQIGLDFGAGMLLPATRGRNIMVELRYSLGHSYMGKANSVNNRVADYADNLELSGKVLNFSVAYVFEHHIHGWKKGKSVSK
ncbi:MAG: PorT family protein [Bacteroidota bacterium]|nr:PorT family protein [Bacteroidota bacterium]